MLRSIAVASLLAPFALAQHQHSSDRASVLLFHAPSATGASSSSGSSGSIIKTYTAPDANAIVSAFLNIEEYERLHDGLDLPEQIVLSAAAASSSGSGQQERGHSLMILAEKLGREGSVQGGLSCPYCFV